MPEYIEIDERVDVLASLECCAFSLQQTEQLDRAWKWVVLSLHSALQGAMVCHLNGTAELGALQESSARKSHKWYDENCSNKFPREFVASADELFKRLWCERCRIEKATGGVIKITRQQQNSFDRLHRLRNEFTHFSPKGWCIELAYIQEMIGDILDVIDAIEKDNICLSTSL